MNHSTLNSRFSGFSRFLLPILVAASVAGCGAKSKLEQPPTTYTVTGKVLGKGGQPVSIGDLTFQSTMQPKWRARAALRPDGTFTLETLVEGNKIPGVIAGPHDVTYYPPMSAAQTEVPINLPLPITVEARNNQEFTIDLGQL